MIEAITVVENLMKVVRAAGLFNFELKQVLDDFLGDVQLVGEYADTRREITDRFAERMHSIYEQAEAAATTSGEPEVQHEKVGAKRETPEIHIVAHSEGTVVALLGLLQGLRDAKPWAWAVRSLSTLGSPIDKHLVLFPEMWEEVQNIKTPLPDSYQPIRWANYYDLGDPVGFALDSAQRRLTPWGWSRFFSFPKDADLGFSRYVMPGVAHNEYWKDKEVFADIWEHGIEGKKRAPRGRGALSWFRTSGLKSKPWVYPLSTAIPYGISALLHLIAFLILYLKVVQLLKLPQPGQVLAGNIAGLTSVLIGLTLATRLPRLTKARKWHVFGWGTLVMGLVAYWRLVDLGAQALIGDLFTKWPPLVAVGETVSQSLNARDVGAGVMTARLGTVGAVLLAAVVASCWRRHKPQTVDRVWGCPGLWSGDRDGPEARIRGSLLASHHCWRCLPLPLVAGRADIRSRLHVASIHKKCRSRDTDGRGRVNLGRGHCYLPQT
jgi:hypothetical protein